MFLVSAYSCVCAIVENEDVVGVAPTGDAPTTFEACLDEGQLLQAEGLAKL